MSPQKPWCTRKCARFRVPQITMNTYFVLAGCVLAVALIAAVFYLRLVSAFTGNLGKRLTNPSRGKPGEQIDLHAIFLPVPGCGGTASPFTTKIEAYLRMAGLPYKTRSADLVSSPNGRVSSPGKFAASLLSPLLVPPPCPQSMPTSSYGTNKTIAVN